ncbi:MAG: LysR family transcriptional regulator [Planctomycetota bacterium]|nr:LysR family transcriptional regulator [Planctomycetota bacterium]
MNNLNYHHLHYFWMVARHGSVSEAARRLSLAQPTISAQLRHLEQAVGGKLFTRSGRGLELTDTGKLVRSYADDIFALGQELEHALSGSGGRALPLRIGVAEEVSKLVAWRLLRPGLQEGAARLYFRQDRGERLLSELRMHNLDLVLATEPAPAAGRVRLDSHLLDEADIGVFAPPGQAEHYRDEFPASLEAAPFLLQADKTNLRHKLDQWFADEGLHPRIVGEFEDPALLKVFASDGMGLLAAPLSIQDELRDRYGIELVAVIPSVTERYYLVTTHRQTRHPMVVAAQG